VHTPPRHLLDTKEPPHLWVLPPRLPLYCREAAQGNIPGVASNPPNTKRVIWVSAVASVPHPGEFRREKSTPSPTATGTYHPTL
jgi:hypothetical protein